MKTKTINIDPKTHKELKTIATNQEITIIKLIKNLLEQYKNNNLK